MRSSAFPASLMAKECPEESSSFRIVIQEELSLLELCNLQKRGFSVVKTPHVGNFYPNNLAVGKLGIKMVLYDRNVGRVDKNFHPHTIIKDGCRYKVACGERLMTHAQANREIENSSLEVGARLADYHVSALREAFPEGNFVLYTDYLANHRQIVYSILETVSGSGFLPGKFGWFRKVNRYGEVTTFHNPVKWEDVSRAGVFGINNENEGYLIPNFLNVLLCGVIEAIDSNCNEVYHLSGPDMVRYIGSMTKDLSHCLTLLSSKDCRFPSNIIFHLVPAANMRFAVYGSRKKALDDLISAYLSAFDYKLKKGEFIKSLKDPSERKIYGAMFKGAEQKLRAELAEAVKGCPEVFYDIYDGSFISQHDIPSNGLYIPRWSLKTSIKEINRAFYAMNNLRK